MYSVSEVRFNKRIVLFEPPRLMSQSVCICTVQFNKIGVFPSAGVLYWYVMSKRRLFDAQVSCMVADYCMESNNTAVQSLSPPQVSTNLCTNGLTVQLSLY